MHTEDTVNKYSYPCDTPSLIRTITSLSKEVYDYYTTFRSYMIVDNAYSNPRTPLNILAANMLYAIGKRSVTVILLYLRRDNEANWAPILIKTDTRGIPTRPERHTDKRHSVGAFVCKAWVIRRF